MKKFLAVFLAVMMLVLAVSVSALSLDDFTKPMNNYTSEAEVAISFNTAKQLVSALEELGINLSEAVEYEMIDFVPFLESLFNITGKAAIKFDTSEDYNQIKLYMEADYDYGVELNQNLSLTADMKQKLWIDIDLSDVANPKYYMVMMSPISTKYMYVDYFEGMSEEEKLMATALLKSVLNKEFIDSVNAEITKIYDEYTEFSADKKTMTVSIDNDGFLKILDKIIELVISRLAVIIPGFSESMGDFQIPKMAELGIKILGEKGMVIECNTDGTMSYTCDINININEIYFDITGEEIPMENDLVIGITLSEKQTLSEIGSTKIVFPELTEENSINLNEALYAETEDDIYYDDGEYYEEYEPEYPNFYVDIYTEYVPVVNGTVYVPFREALENAYDGNVDITYDKGIITVKSEHFKDLETLSFKVGETKANVDGYEFEVGEIILENGVTYVSADFFEIIFGWSQDWATYDFLWGMYNFGFYTEPYEDYYDEW